MHKDLLSVVLNSFSDEKNDFTLNDLGNKLEILFGLNPSEEKTLWNRSDGAICSRLCVIFVERGRNCCLPIFSRWIVWFFQSKIFCVWKTFLKTGSCLIFTVRSSDCHILFGREWKIFSGTDDRPLDAIFVSLDLCHRGCKIPYFLMRHNKFG